MANVENPEIQQAYEDVRTDSTGYNWYAHTHFHFHIIIIRSSSVPFVVNGAISVLFLSFAGSVTTLYIRAQLHSVN
jgi:hypothetical protein